MGKQRNKGKIALLSALFGIASCLAAGHGINCATSCSIVSSSYGYNNRIRDEEFNNEFNEENIGLEKRLLEKNAAAETEITYDIYVSPLIKSFFDDAGNANDNAGWAKEAENAVSGLETFRQHGIGFNLRHANILREGLEQYSIDSIFYFVADSQETKPDMTFIILPASVTNESFISRLIYLRLGNTDIGGSYAMVYMTGNGDSNRRTFAHEAGHMMGLAHKDYNKFMQAIDPFHLYCSGLMIQGNTLLDDYSLDEEELAIIEKAKERFQ